MSQDSRPRSSPSEPAPYAALVFDLDGTLVDSYEPIAASLNHARAAFGLAPKPLDAVRSEVGRGLEALIGDNLGPSRVAAGIRLFRSHYRRVFLEATRPMPGVAATLAELARRSVPMAVASNKPAYFSREIIDSLGFGDCFVAVVGPEMVERPKPDPGMLLLALGRIGRPAERVLYVGDMVLDVETARAAGLAVAVIPGGSESRRALEAARPDFLLLRFEQLTDLVVG